MANNPKNYNDTSPAAPSGKTNVKWQAATPDSDPTVVRDVSAYIDEVEETQLSFTDNTTADSTSSQHGLLPKLSGSATDALKGDGTWGAVSGGSSGNSQVMFEHHADQGNSSTSETDLYSDSVSGGALSADGAAIKARYAGILVNSSSTKRVRAYFGGTLIFDSGALTMSAVGEWDVSIVIIRDSSTSVRCSTSANFSGTSTVEFAQYVAISGLTLTASQILKITGTAAGGSAANNDLVAKAAVIEAAGSLGVSARATYSYTTASIANNANELGRITIAKSFVAISISASALCRVRLYSNPTSQSADETRDALTRPTVNTPHGVILDIGLTNSGYATSFILSPEALAANAESPQVSGCPITITNLSGSAAAITVNIVCRPEEI